MLKSVFLFLEFLTIIMGKESVRENHVGFPCRSADCSDSSPSSAAALSRPGAAGGLRAGGQAGHLQRDACALTCSLLSAAPLHGEQARRSHHLHFLLESH